MDGTNKRTLTEEHKQKISKSNTGRKWSDASRKNASVARTGKKRGSPSDETRQRISQGHLGKPKKKWSEEAKCRHRINQKDRWARKSEAELAIHSEKIRNAKKKK